jgi:quercetin dioxygenase-like cupin family protein
MAIALAVLAATLWTLGALGAGNIAAAQEAPTASTPEAIGPGVTFTLLPASEDPPTLYRIGIAPGAALPFAGDPAISLVYVESGAATLTMNAPVSDLRATPAAGAGGDTLQVKQGDYFVLPPLVAGEIRNEGAEPVAIVIAAITPDLLPPAAAGTPTAP